MEEKDGKSEIEKLRQETIFLRNKVRNLERAQIEKTTIHNFLESILDTGLSDKMLVDITEDEVIVLGRLNVTGSSRKQMRHVTPYSFVKQLVKVRVESESATTQTIKEPIIIRNLSCPEKYIHINKNFVLINYFIL